MNKARILAFLDLNYSAEGGGAKFEEMIRTPGMTQRRIAEHYGTVNQTAHRWIRQYGITDWRAREVKEVAG